MELRASLRYVWREPITHALANIGGTEAHVLAIDRLRFCPVKAVDVHLVLNAWRKQPGREAVPAQALGGAVDSHDTHRVVWLRKNFPPGR